MKSLKEYKKIKIKIYIILEQEGSCKHEYTVRNSKGKDGMQNMHKKTTVSEKKRDKL